MEKYLHIKMITGTNPLKGDVNKNIGILFYASTYVKDERKDFFLRKNVYTNITIKHRLSNSIWLLFL